MFNPVVAVHMLQNVTWTCCGKCYKTQRL